MGGKVGTSGGPVGDINMTPLIDIVLVVLIIMMVNIPIQIERMGLKLPSPNPPPVPPPPSADQLVVAVYEDGTLSLNRRLMKLEKLQYELQRRMKSMSKKQVFVDAHPKANYGLVVQMVDLARNAGGCAGEIPESEGTDDYCPVQVGLAKMKPSGPLEATEVDPGTIPRGVTSGMPRVVGALKAADADASLKAVLPQIMGCYVQELATTPDLSGQLVVEVTVGPSGEHLSPPLVQPGTGTLQDPELELCINGVLPQMQFPRLGAGNTARAVLPLLFSPG